MKRFEGMRVLLWGASLTVIACGDKGEQGPPANNASFTVRSQTPVSLVPLTP